MEAMEMLKRGFRHDTWAREKLLSLISDLSNEEFTRSHGVLGSISSRFAHIVDIDVLWMRRVYERESPASPPDKERFLDVREFSSYCRQVTQLRNEALLRLNPNDLLEVIEFCDTRGRRYRETIGDMLFHVVLHAAHHRGQLVLCLKALGYSAGYVDYYVWAGEALAP
jgi:uncharacterized damage-inducible protein DinB